MDCGLTSGVRSASGNGWRTVLLGDCVVVNDVTYSSKEAWPFVNYLDTGNITENQISEIQNIVVAEGKLPSRARRKVQPGDVVYSTVRPNQRHFGLIKNVPENFLVSTGFAVIRAKPEIACTDFIYWYLAQDHVVEYLHTLAENNTSAYPAIRPADLEKLELHISPLLEQRRIADFLGVLDGKIELNRRMSETLEKMARSLYKSWFEDFEPVRAKMGGWWHRGDSLPGLPAELYDLFPDRLVASELGDIPDGWNVGTFGNLVVVSHEKVNPGGSPESIYSHFSIPAHDRGRRPEPELGSSIKSAKTPVHPGAVLVSKLNPDIERVWLVDVGSNQNAVCSTEFLVLRAQPPVERCYVYCLARSVPFRQKIESLVTGTSKSHQRAPEKSILALPALIPPVPLARAFETSVGELMERSLVALRESDALARQLDYLLPNLISGEIRMPDFFDCTESFEENDQ